LASDANLLIDYVREFSQNYYFKYKSITPVENLVRYISDVKQLKTQYGSSRPYGAGFLFAGWDRFFGYQIYSTEPSGVYSAWKAHAIGQNYQNAQSTLKQYYSDQTNLNEGLKLSVKVLRKTLDKNKMTGDNSKFNKFYINNNIIYLPYFMNFYYYFIFIILFLLIFLLS
jgi:20S proteasome subunit alpha 3